MNQKSTVMLAVFVALGVILVAGLIAIPVLEQSVQANKGGIPNEHASPTAFRHAHGTRGGGGTCQTCG